MNTQLRLKTFLGLFFLAATVSFTAGCGESDTSWTPGTPLPKDKLRIAILYLDSAGDGGYSYAHASGIEQMRVALGLREDQIIHKVNISDSDERMIDHAMRESIAAGARLILATSWGYMDVCEKLADEYPDVIFAHASGYKYNSSNLTSYFGKMYQARYLGGIVAGMKTQTGKIGFIAAKGLDNTEVTASINAFALGVESVNRDARIYLRVINSWYDPFAEKRAAKLLIAEGCDVITQYCNTPSPQIEAAESGVWSIGYNSDMERLAPEAVLTSVVWHWDVYYTRLVKSLLDGTFTTTPYYGGLTEGVVGLAPLNAAITTQAMKDAVKRAEEQLRDGSLQVFQGTLRTNGGKIVERTGEGLTDQEITRGMNWYYYTVSGY